jgi:2',3'-cyclic-nucleotide 2'-phosphodiesterase (5'-nucleotidase family)
LREDEGCHFIIALTHMRIPNDNYLAKKTTQVDLILGGHDHSYYLRQTKDNLVVKSGADYRNLNHIVLEMLPAKPEDCPVPPFIGDENCETDVPYRFWIKGKFHVTITKKDITQDIKPNSMLVEHVEDFSKELAKEFAKPLVYIKSELDTVFAGIRTSERYIGNFLADLMAVEMCTDVALVNSGGIRADYVYDNGILSLGDMFDIFPFATHILKLEISGAVLIKLLENSVSKYPKLEGRFAQVSGVKFRFNPNLPEGERVLKSSVMVRSKLCHEEKLYTIAVPEFIAEGKDGYDPIKGSLVIVDGENGPQMMPILKDFLFLAKDPLMRKEFKLATGDFKKYIAEKVEKHAKCIFKKKIEIIKNLSLFRGALGAGMQVDPKTGMLKFASLATFAEKNGDSLKEDEGDKTNTEKMIEQSKDDKITKDEKSEPKKEEKKSAGGMCCFTKTTPIDVIYLFLTAK